MLLSQVPDVTTLAMHLAGVLFGAIVLRAACWLFNKLAGGADSPPAVPEPGLVKAIAIVLIAMVIQVGAVTILPLVAKTVEMELHGQTTPGVELVSVGKMVIQRREAGETWAEAERIWTQCLQRS